MAAEWLGFNANWAIKPSQDGYHWLQFRDRKVTAKEVSDFPRPVSELCRQDWKPDLV